MRARERAEREGAVGSEQVVEEDVARIGRAVVEGEDRDELLVDLHVGARVDRAPEMKRALDLAALQPVADDLAQCGLVRLDFVGHLEGDVEIAVVNGAEFPRQCPERRLGRLPRKACHTV